jgi:hypothetical protein
MIIDLDSPAAALTTIVDRPDRALRPSLAASGTVEDGTWQA